MGIQEEEKGAPSAFLAAPTFGADIGRIGVLGAWKSAADSMLVMPADGEVDGRRAAMWQQNTRVQGTAQH